MVFLGILGEDVDFCEIMVKVVWVFWDLYEEYWCSFDLCFVGFEEFGFDLLKNFLDGLF